MTIGADNDSGTKQIHQGAELEANQAANEARGITRRQLTATNSLSAADLDSCSPCVLFAVIFTDAKTPDGQKGCILKISFTSKVNVNTALVVNICLPICSVCKN